MKRLFFLTMIACFAMTAVFAAGGQSSSGGNKSAGTALSGEAVRFPLPERVTFTYWTPLSTQVSRTAKNYAETELYRTLGEKTNVYFEFIHPTIGEEPTAFNLLVASGDLPDIIEHNYSNYPGGAVGALNDGIIMPLNGLIDTYMPNYKRQISQYPDINALTRNEKGEYAYLPFLLPSDQPLINWGGVIRTDLLKKVNMQAPETVDEVYAVLKAFKAAGVPCPMFIGNSTADRSLKWVGGTNPFLGAWGVAYGFYNDNGKVKLGQAEPAYRDFLTTLRKWYEEGLLEPEFPTVVKAADLEARAFSGDWGMWYYNVGPIEKATSEGRKKVPDYTLGGIKPITLKKGEKNRFVRFQSPVGGGGVTIPAGTRRADIIASFFDLGYDQAEIGRLYSLGIEGTSYILENPATAGITDNIIHNSYGVAMTDALYRYCRGMNGGPFRIDPLFYTAYWSMPEQRDALAKWSTDLEATFANDPAIYGIMTAEEVERVSALEVQMQTYIDEMFIKFVTGRESLSYFDTYLGELKKLGMDNILAVQQAVNDRYHAGVK